MDELKSSGWTPPPALVDLSGIPTTSLGALGRAFEGALEKTMVLPWHGAVGCCVESLCPSSCCNGTAYVAASFGSSRSNVELAEEERYCGNSPAVVFVYDELLRKSFANRAECYDKSLDLPVVLSKSNTLTANRCGS